jgi:hypothetical protein
LIRELVDDNHQLSVTRDQYLAASPHALAQELIDTQEMVRYLTWGLCIIGFLVWIMLTSRR